MGHNQICSRFETAQKLQLKQLYLSNQIRYRGDSRGIGKILKSSYYHKNFIIFGQVDLDWHCNKDRLLQKQIRENKMYQPNYLFIDSNFNILNYGTYGHAHKVPALITKIQLTHKHNNKSTRHTKVHTTLLDLTWLNLTHATNFLLHRREFQHLWARFMGKLLINPWQVEAHPLVIYHLLISLKCLLPCL